MITRRQFVMRGGLLVSAAGLLTSNVRAASYLPNRRKAFRTGWTPNSITGLKSWMVADNIAGANDDPVGTFTDASDSPINATQSTAGYKPLLKTNYVNGHSAIYSDGVDDYLTYASHPLSGGSAGTLFVVCKSVLDVPGPAFGAPIGKWGSATSAADHWPYLDGTFYEGSLSSSRYTVGNPSRSFAVWNVVTIISASANYTFYINGTSFYSTGTNTFGATQTPELMRSFGNTIAYPWNGYLAELCCYNTALGSTDRGLVETYLINRYGIS